MSLVYQLHTCKKSNSEIEKVLMCTRNIVIMHILLEIVHFHTAVILQQLFLESVWVVVISDVKEMADIAAALVHNLQSQIWCDLIHNNLRTE